MTAIHIGICDDDLDFCTELRPLVDQLLPQPHTIDTYPHGEALLFGMVDRPCSLLLLDMELPGQNGIEVAEQVRETYPNTAIIILTNYDKFVYQGYRVKAVDYLLKPVSVESLQRAIQDALTQIEQNDRSFISTEWNDEIHLFRIGEVMYFRREGRHTVLHTEKSALPLRRNLNDLDHKHWPFFVRISRTHILNIAWIQKCDSATRVVCMMDGVRFKISRRRYEIVEDLLMTHTTVLSR